MSNRFEDERGVIQDLLEGDDYSVTHITTVDGAVRGNHVHDRTTQWTHVLAGSLEVVTGRVDTVVMAGQVIVHRPGEPHAWKALEDTECLVVTSGPRSGENYESDTRRLEQPLLP